MYLVLLSTVGLRTVVALKLQHFVHFLFIYYRTVDRGSHSVQHLIDFLFIHYRTADRGSPLL